MQYKTIVLEMLKARPVMHVNLCEKRTLLPTMNRLARRLKASHEAWKKDLVEIRPDSDPSQISYEAMERAVKELEGSLPPLPDDEPFPLDEAMAFINGRIA